jgi:hypothetical protein
MEITQQLPSPGSVRLLAASQHPAGPPARHPRGDASPDQRAERAQTLRTLRDLAIDLGIPLGSYYLLRDGFGLSLWLSLAVSSIGPAIRSGYGLIVKRELNTLAILMLIVNIAGIGVSFVTGDPRALIAKDSVVSSVIGFSMLGSVALRRPIMTPGLRIFLTKGTDRREAAWERLHGTSATFRRLDGLYTVIWGMALLAECTARLIGAYALPVTTMVWLGGVMTMGAIGVAIVAGGVAAGPMLHMVEHDVESREA